MLNWLDYSIITIILVSAVISLIRGFIREMLSLIAWVLAVWVAMRFYPDLANYLQNTIHQPGFRYLAAFIGLFLGTLVICGIINAIIAYFMSQFGFSGIDRMLGVIFGIARGVFVVLILIIMSGFTPMVKQDFWTSSIIVPKLEPTAGWLLNLMPKDFQKQIKAYIGNTDNHSVQDNTI